MNITNHRTPLSSLRPRDSFGRPTVLFADSLLAVFLLAGFAGPSAASPPQSFQQPPVIHFNASGEYSFSSARITVDVRLESAARLTVTLTAPSGGSETLSMDGDGDRYSWTGQLKEAGTWRADATVGGAGGPKSASASVSVDEGAPTCSLSISAPGQPTHYLTAEFVVNSCDASAVTGSLAIRHITVLQDGAQISTLDASDQCERRFILPGGGDYEARVRIADDRGVTATCSSADLGVDELHSRYWPSLDLAGGIYDTQRPDVSEPGASMLGGLGVGLVLPHNAELEQTNAFIIRATAGANYSTSDEYWFGSTLDVALTRQSAGGFFGAGAGLWGIGDNDILDAAVFVTGGVNLPQYTGAGRAQMFGEVRVFARHITAFQDNFSGIVGVRFNFRPTHKLRAR